MWQNAVLSMRGNDCKAMQSVLDRDVAVYRRQISENKSVKIKLVDL